MIPQRRWEALDILRGLSVIGMLLNLNPGAWAHQYSWLMHAKWEGGTLMDMVAPAFLFCIGAAIPLSLERRMHTGMTRELAIVRILWRSLILIAVGLFLNAYPGFDFKHLRIPGVLQRIGLTYCIVASFVVLICWPRNARELKFHPRLLIGSASFILVSYWALLAFVPVPGFAANRFDPVGSWPAFVDRAVLGTDHMFIYWPVDGKIMFDPDGLVSTYPVCFNLLLGVLTGFAYAKNLFHRPATIALIAGVVLVASALLLSPVCPIIKNIWTSTFALFTGGFALIALGCVMALLRLPRVAALFSPARIFGGNPLVAYIVCFLLMPVLDLNFLRRPDGVISIRNLSQLLMPRLIDATLASFLFGIGYIAFVFCILVYLDRKRWWLKI